MNWILITDDKEIVNPSEEEIIRVFWTLTKEEDFIVLKNDKIGRIGLCGPISDKQCLMNCFFNVNGKEVPQFDQILESPTIGLNRILHFYRGDIEMASHLDATQKYQEETGKLIFILLFMILAFFVYYCVTNAASIFVPEPSCKSIRSSLYLITETQKHRGEAIALAKSAKAAWYFS